MARRPQRPRDLNQRAFQIVQETTGQAERPDSDAGKGPAAVALGRRGGLKGGRARADKLTPEQRSEIARKGGQAPRKDRREPVAYFSRRRREPDEG